MKAIDFFCGAGGLSRGLIDAGIDVVAGIDLDASCRTTYEHNNHKSAFIEADVSDLDEHSLCNYLKGATSKELLFAGCAPCQPFSKHTRGPRKRKDARILSHFGRLIAAYKPGFVLIENVPGIAKVGGYSTFKRFLQTLGTNGYRYAFEVLDAKWYGVPQNRRRLVLIATLGMPASLPRPRYGKNLRRFRTVRDAISHYPAIKAGKTDESFPNHVAASVSAKNLERLQNTPHDGGDRRSWPTHLELACHSGEHTGHTDVYGRMYWHRPAPAITGRCNSLSNGRYGHPEQDRAISLREAAAIQTFPDRYVFFGSNKSVAQQIGNAVPVRMAEEIGRHILRLATKTQVAETAEF